MGGFNVGDVVQLKSGGARMVVEIVEGNHVGVLWFSYNSSAFGGGGEYLRRESFHTDLLKTADPPFSPVKL